MRYPVFPARIIVRWLLPACLLIPGLLFAQETNSIRIERQDELWSVEAMNVPLQDFLQALNDRAGGVLKLESVPDRRISIRLSQVPLDEVLNQLDVDMAIIYSRDAATHKVSLDGGWALGRDGRIRRVSAAELAEKSDALGRKLSELLAADAGFIYRCAYPVTVDIEAGITNWPRDVIWHSVTATNVSVVDDPLAPWKHDTPPDDNLDAAFNFSTVADDDNLYLAVQVNDDVAVTNESTDDLLLFMDDSLEFYLDGGHERATSYDTNDAQITIGRASVGADPNAPRISPWETFGHGIPGNQTGTRAVVRNTERGWEVLAQIPLASFGVRPVDGGQIGFDIHLNDDDDGGMRDHKLMWSAEEQKNGEAAYHNPSVFGQLEFYNYQDGIRIDRDPHAR